MNTAKALVFPGGEVSVTLPSRSALLNSAEEWLKVAQETIDNIPKSRETIALRRQLRHVAHAVMEARYAE